MKLFLNRFILNFPRLYIKQFPYAWFVFIALWTWPPNFSIIFLMIILIGLSLLWWQHGAWVEKIRNEYAPQGGKFYIDRPTIPMARALRNITLLVIVSILSALFLKDQIRLAVWQIALILVGFLLMYRDALFFGAQVSYIITASGIGIYFAPGHLDYRLFLGFNEISRIERCGFQKDKGWTSFTRAPAPQDGLLLIPKNPNGFSKRIELLYIAPQDIEAFQKQLPFGF